MSATLLILGGGAVGCEFSQLFARFGVEVTIIEGEDRLLPSEEPLTSEIVTGAFESEGIDVRTGDRVEAVSSDDGAITATLSNGSEVSADQILVATGRTTDLEGLGLEDAGISVADGFIQVDERVRAAPDIWAVGDVTGVGMFTHVALYQGSMAVGDILGNDPSPADYDVLPRAVFTDPEVGSVGLTEAQAREAGHDVSVVTKQVGATFRGWVHGAQNPGVFKLVVDGDADMLLGATSVGPNGAEILGMLSVVMKAGMPMSDLADMIYAFPTFYGGLGEAIGAYGRGLVQVLDPENEPLFTD